MKKNTLYQNIDILKEATAYGQQLLLKGGLDELDSLLQDMRQLAAATEQMLQQEEGHLISLAARCCRNLCASIDEFHKRPEIRARVFSLEVVNLVWNLDTILHRQYDVLNHPENGMLHRQEILDQSRAAHAAVNRKNYRYKVSIFLQAYNKLDYTKAAVESIYRYTDFSRGDVELITINNGSTDGTREYFESLPNEKKLNYRENVLGVTHCPAIYEGQFRVEFSNDIIATPYWLENLLTCIESDEDIAMVVPVCGDYSISCNQGIHVDYQNSFEGMPAMQKFAAQYNRSDPRLWEERAVLMPFLSCWRRELLDAGIFDCIYTQAEFVDDDVSTTLRRTGWKQILLRDTYMHHFGGVTLGAGRAAAKNNSLKNMRRVYYAKWGVDAWDSRSMYPYTAEFMAQVSLHERADILWIEPLYGSTFLSLQQKFREAQLQIGSSTALVRDSRYQADAEAFFSQVIPVRDYEIWLENCQQTYDIISTGQYFNDIIKYEPIRLIRLLYSKLKPGGCLLLPVQNRQGINPVIQLLFQDGRFWFDEEDAVYKIMDVQRLFHYLNTVLYPGQCNWKIAKILGDREKTEKLLSGLMKSGLSADWQKLCDTLMMNHCWIEIRK